jgi:hypothetical protein
VNVRMLVGATLAAAGLIGAGCGGSSSSSSTSTTALTKSEFLAQGNKICAEGSKTINEAAKKEFGKGKPSASQVNQFATQTLIPNIQAQINGVKGLAAPSGDEAQVTAIVTAAQSALDKAKANPKLLTQNGGQDPFAASNKLANAYGLTKCGSGG